MKRSETGRCTFSVSGRHFWIQAEEKPKGGTPPRYRCRNCRQITAEPFPLFANAGDGEEARHD